MILCYITYCIYLTKVLLYAMLVTKRGITSEECGCISQDACNPKG